MDLKLLKTIYYFNYFNYKIWRHKRVDEIYEWMNERLIFQTQLAMNEWSVLVGLSIVLQLNKIKSSKTENILILWKWLTVASIFSFFFEDKMYVKW